MIFGNKMFRQAENSDLKLKKVTKENSKSIPDKISGDLPMKVFRRKLTNEWQITMFNYANY